jgi:hypothetical protein
MPMQVKLKWLLLNAYTPYADMVNTQTQHQLVQKGSAKTLNVLNAFND